MAAVACLSMYVGAAAAQTFGLSRINDVTRPFFGGAPLTVVVMALAGSLIGFSMLPPLESRKKLYTLVLGNTCIAVVATVLIPTWKHWVIDPVMQPPIALVAAVVMVKAFPVVWDMLPEVVKAFFAKFAPKNDGGAP